MSTQTEAAGITAAMALRYYRFHFVAKGKVSLPKHKPMSHSAYSVGSLQKRPTWAQEITVLFV